MANYKYLGIVIDDKLAWHPHIDSLVKKLNTRMYCLRKLNYFHANANILALFYDSVVSSIWKYCLICWGGNAARGDTDRINRVVNGAAKIIGLAQQSLEDAYADLLFKTLSGIKEDTHHPLHNRLASHLIPRSGRMRLPAAVTNRYLCSFIPQAIKCHNSHHRRSNSVVVIDNNKIF